MSIVLKTAVTLLVLALFLACGAIAGNHVPLLAPPGPVKRLLVYLSRHSVQTRPNHDFPELRSRSYAVAKDRMFLRVERAVTGLGWKIEKADPARSTIDAVVSTPLLHFKDDVHIVLRQAAPGRTEVDIASKSRLGRGDFGANLGHVMALDRALEAAS